MAGQTPATPPASNKAKREKLEAKVQQQAKVIEEQAAKLTELTDALKLSTEKFQAKIQQQAKVIEDQAKKINELTDALNLSNEKLQASLLFIKTVLK